MLCGSSQLLHLPGTVARGAQPGPAEMKKTIQMEQGLGPEDVDQREAGLLQDRERIPRESKRHSCSPHPNTHTH